MAFGSILFIINSFLGKKFYPDKIRPDAQLIEYFFPVIYEEYWYLTTYYKMHLFLPLINKVTEMFQKLS